RPERSSWRPVKGALLDVFKQPFQQQGVSACREMPVGFEQRPFVRGVDQRMAGVEIVERRQLTKLLQGLLEAEAGLAEYLLTIRDCDHGGGRAILPGQSRKHPEHAIEVGLYSRRGDLGDQTGTKVWITRRPPTANPRDCGKPARRYETAPCRIGPAYPRGNHTARGNFDERRRANSDRP